MEISIIVSAAGTIVAITVLCGITYVASGKTTKDALRNLLERINKRYPK